MSDVPIASWNVEDSYQSNAKESELYPHRVFGTGFQNSLQITTKITPDHSFAICKFFSPGFMLSLHTPDELPPISDNYIFIPAQQNVIISIKPKMITTSESLRSYAPHDRGCYFQYERRLRFFRSYSQRKCELECLANFTESVCGCVRFYAPSKCFSQPPTLSIVILELSRVVTGDLVEPQYSTIKTFFSQQLVVLKRHILNIF